MCLVAEKREGNFEIRHFVRQPNPSLVFFFVFFFYLITFREGLVEAFDRHGEGVCAVFVGDSRHFHASHPCSCVARPRRSPL